MLSIHWDSFTPWSALAGGALIGIASAILILFNGRIAGISGVVGGLIKPNLHDSSWRIAFIAGLVIAPVIWQLFTKLPPIHINSSYLTLGLSGFIVGIATRYGAGCTSGHGVCGISRLSPRSILATLVFMLAGFITVYILRHIFKL